MSNDMHPDLKWLAEVCEEWLGSFESLGVQDGEPCWGYSVTSACPYTKPQWLQARQLLGLDDNTMTKEEQELPAQEWTSSVPEGLHDMVNHPPHYQLHEGYEVYDLRQDLAQKAMAANVPHDQYSDWDRALEYLLRMWDKNGLEDAKKGRWYMDKLIAKLEASALRAGELGE